MVRLQKQFLVISVIGGLWLPSFAISATLPITLHDNKGKAIKDAVVYAEAVKGTLNAGPANQEAIIDQVNREFIPHVSAFKVGTKAYFPNNDNIRHHVYSFSPAKNFEIPLYEGTPADPIEFDKPGVVVLGCNIHDWMSSYVFVTETPYFSVTDAEGRATISNLPPGEYDVKVWHPRLKESAKTSKQRISIEKDGSKVLSFEVRLKRVWRPRRAPAKSFRGY